MVADHGQKLPLEQKNPLFQWVYYCLGGMAFFAVSATVIYVLPTLFPIPRDATWFFIILFVGLHAICLLTAKKIHAPDDFILGYAFVAPAIILFICLFFIELIIHPPNEE